MTDIISTLTASALAAWNSNPDAQSTKPLANYIESWMITKGWM